MREREEQGADSVTDTTLSEPQIHGFGGSATRRNTTAPHRAAEGAARCRILLCCICVAPVGGIGATGQKRPNFSESGGLRFSAYI